MHGLIGICLEASSAGGLGFRRMNIVSSGRLERIGGKDAFPSISTGIYKFPIERAAVIAVTTTREFAQQDGRLMEVERVAMESWQGWAEQYRRVRIAAR